MFLIQALVSKKVSSEKVNDEWEENSDDEHNEKDDTGGFSPTLDADTGDAEGFSPTLEQEDGEFSPQLLDSNDADEKIATVCC